MVEGPFRGTWGRMTRRMSTADTWALELFTGIIKLFLGIVFVGGLILRYQNFAGLQTVGQYTFGVLMIIVGLLQLRGCTARTIMRCVLYRLVAAGIAVPMWVVFICLILSNGRGLYFLPIVATLLIFNFVVCDKMGDAVRNEWTARHPKVGPPPPSNSVVGGAK